MALKKLRVKMAAAPATKPGEIPVVTIEGDLIKQYNSADGQAKAAKAVMEDLRPEILELGLREIFERSVAHPKEPSLTVKLQDEQAEVLRVQFTARYLQVADLEGAEELFGSLRGPDGKPVDINDYLQETVAAKFNCGVFLDTDGKFQQTVYDKFRTAIERVASQLKVPCPLETTKEVRPLPSLHEKRWEAFPDPVVQVNLTRICPNTTQIVPVTVKVAAQ
jgi:hypothetical protein